MNRLRTENRLAAGFLLLALLLAQSGALAHTWQHEPGTLQGQACAACASASQLASACIDSARFADFRPALEGPLAHLASHHASIEIMVARSRGPPPKP